MPETISSRDKRLYVLTQTTFNALNQTSGDSDIVAGNAMRFSRFDMSGQEPLVTSANKTGNREPAQGVGRIKRAGGSLAFDIEASGTPGTPPRQGPWFQSVLGDSAVATGSATSTVVSSTDNSSGQVRVTDTSHGFSSGDFVRIQGHSEAGINRLWMIAVNDANTYDLVGSVYVADGTSGTSSQVHNTYNDADDALVPVEAWVRRDPADANTPESVAVGCFPSSMTIRGGGDFLQAEFAINAGWNLSKQYFSSATAQEKAGLTSFPTEPTATFVGQTISGRDGYLIADGLNIGTIADCSLIVESGFQYDERSWNAKLPSRVQRGSKLARAEFTVVASPDANLTNLSNKAESKSPVDVYAVWGSTAGVMFAIAIDNFQFDVPQFSESDPDEDMQFTGSAFAPQNVRCIFA